MLTPRHHAVVVRLIVNQIRILELRGPEALVPQQDLRDDFQGHPTSACTRRGMPAEVMWSQGHSHLGGRARD